MTRFGHVLGLLLLLACGLPAALAAAPLPASQAALIDRSVTAELARDKIAGATVAIARGGTIVYEHGYGVRDVASKTPLDAQSVFEIGSVTKQFTAAAVMQLVQRGRIELDKPVATYLAGIPSGDRITVRELLDQTSGLANYTDLPAFFENTGGAVKPSAIVATIASKPLAFTPGSAWAYSNTNYVVLGMLVERVAGESYPKYLAEHIFTPLSLYATRYSSAYLESGDVAFADGQAGGGSPLIGFTNLDWAYAAGGLWSTAPDLVRWEDALFSGRVVDRASLDAMMAPPTLPNGASTGYGFGLIVSNLYGEREIWHTGGLPGYGSIDAYFPNEHLEIAALGNSMRFDGPAIVRAALAAVVPSVATKIAAESSATPAPGEDPAITKLATSLVSQAQTGNVDRSALDTRMNTALTPAMIAQVSSQLAPLGTPKNVVFLGSVQNSEGTTYHYRVVWDAATLDEIIVVDTDKKISGWVFRPPIDTPAGPSGASSASPGPSPAPSASPPR